MDETTKHKCRSSFVAKHIKMSKRLDPFAEAPSLDAKMALSSNAVSGRLRYTRGPMVSGMKMDFIVMSRASFQAQVVRDVCVELPSGDEEQGARGKLKKSIYSTRGAAQNWGQACTQRMIDTGLVR